MYRKNTSGQNLGFRLVNSGTGGALTGATVTAYRSIDGGAQAAVSGTIAEIGNGQYNLALAAADLAGNQISFLFLASGAVPEEKTVLTTAADPTDAQRLGLQALPGAGTLAVSPTVSLANGSITTASYATSVTIPDARLANLDAAVSTRLASASYAAPDNASVAAIKAKTDLLALDTHGYVTVADASLTDAKFSAPVPASATAARASGPLAELRYYVRCGMAINREERDLAAKTITHYADDDSTVLGSRSYSDTTTPGSNSRGTQVLVKLN